MRIRLPGLTVALALAVGAIAVGRALPAVSPLILAILLGLAAGNLAPSSFRLEPGIQFAARNLLRLAVVLLGARLSFADLTAIGGPGLAVVALTVVATFFGAQLLGRLLGVGRDLSLLIGICHLRSLGCCSHEWSHRRRRGRSHLRHWPRHHGWQPFDPGPAADRPGVGHGSGGVWNLDGRRRP